MHVLTDEDRQKAHEKSLSEESRAKRAATWERRRKALEEYVLSAWQRGMVPIAIATKANRSVEAVAAIIREAGHEIPAYMTVTGGRAPTCGCCGSAIDAA